MPQFNAKLYELYLHTFARVRSENKVSHPDIPTAQSMREAVEPAQAAVAIALGTKDATDDGASLNDFWEFKANVERMLSPKAPAEQ